MSPLILSLVLSAAPPAAEVGATSGGLRLADREPIRFLPEWPVRLQSKVVSIGRAFSGEIGFYVEDVRTRERYGHNAETSMYLASGIKLVVMMALFRAVASGEVSLSEELRYRPEDQRDGAPLMNYVRPGTPMPIEVLLEAMIRVSDNAATDMLIRKVGVHSVNEVLVKEGLSGFGPITPLIDVRRLVYGQLHPRLSDLTAKDIFELAMARKPVNRVRQIEILLGEEEGTYSVGQYQSAYDRYYREGWNSASMRAMGRLLARIAKGEAVSPGASKAMLEVMGGTRTGLRRFRAGLPRNVRLAHKTGTQNRRACDFGVMFLPPDDRPVVLAASLKNAPLPEAERTLASLARATVQVFLPVRRAPRRSMGPKSTGPKTAPRRRRR